MLFRELEKEEEEVNGELKGGGAEEIDEVIGAEAFVEVDKEGREDKVPFPGEGFPQGSNSGATSSHGEENELIFGV